MADNKSITLSVANRISLRAKKTSNGYSLLMDFRYEQKRYREYLNLYISTDNKRKFTKQDKININIAESIRANRILEINTGKFDPNPISSSPDSVKMMFAKHIEFRKAASRGEYKPWFKWQATYKKFCEYENGDPSFREISPDYLDKFKNFLIVSGLKHNSVATYMSVMNAVLNLAVRDGIIDINPMQKIKVPTYKDPGRVFLTFDEIMKLDQTIFRGNYEIKDAFLFNCWIGMRWGDLRALTSKQIAEELIIHNKEEIKLHFVYLQQQKTKEYQRLPIAQPAMKYLDGKLRRDLLFNLPLNNKYANKLLKRWGLEAGITKPITTHVARHTAATLMLNKGVNLKVVQKYLGHTKSTTTEIYAKLLDDSLIDAVTKMNS